MRLSLRAALGAAIAILISVPAHAESAEDKRARKEAEIPTCSHKIGTLAIYEPEHDWWTQYNLGAPEAIIKVFVMKSGCFTLLDRGKGMEAMEKERALASGGDLRQGSNMGKGQIRTADYVLVPDLVSKNSNAGGTNVGGILGGFIGGGAGALISGINISKKSADVTLAVTDMRSSEQVALTEGQATKSDVGFGVAGGFGSWGGFGGAGVSSYTDTEIGQVIALAYLDAYTKLISQLGSVSDNASATNSQQAVTMSRPGKMYERPNPKSKVVRALDPGMMLYPTGSKEGVFWEVSDELGNKGWVSSLLVSLSR